MVKSCATSGVFFPEEPTALRHEIEGYLKSAAVMGERPRAVISPHAGTVYSGECAGYAYAQAKDQGFTRVVVAAPSHYVGFEGIALLDEAAYATPLGEIAIDQDGVRGLLGAELPGVFSHPQPFEKEHALEVQLPFVQVALGSDVRLIPIVYSQADPAGLSALLEACDDGETLFVISSDLSHFYSEAEANRLDSHCHLGIENLDTRQLQPCEACGKIGIEAAILFARRHELRARMLNYMTSAKHSGDSSRVVGYGSYIIY